MPGTANWSGRPHRPGASPALRGTLRRGDVAVRIFPPRGGNAQLSRQICRSPGRVPRGDVGRSRRGRRSAAASGAVGIPSTGVRTVTASAAEARETSGATTGGLLRYVRRIAGEDAVDRVLERSGVPHAAEELEDQSRWWSYDTR